MYAAMPPSETGGVHSPSGGEGIGPFQKATPCTLTAQGADGVRQQILERRPGSAEPIESARIKRTRTTSGYGAIPTRKNSAAFGPKDLRREMKKLNEAPKISSKTLSARGYSEIPMPTTDSNSKCQEVATNGLKSLKHKESNPAILNGRQWFSIFVNNPNEAPS